MKLSVTVGLNSRADKNLVIKLFKQNQNVDLVEIEPGSLWLSTGKLDQRKALELVARTAAAMEMLQVFSIRLDK